MMQEKNQEYSVLPALTRLARRPVLWAALAVLAALGYGYAMAVPAVDMDDLAIATYQQGGEFLRQGRFTVWLLQALTGIMEYQPFWPEFFFAVCLVLAGLLLAALFYTAAGRQTALPGALLLAGGLLLWPYHGEILMYSNQCGVGLGYLLCVLAACLVWPGMAGGWRRSLPGGLGAAVCLMFALGLYESFAPVWLTLVFALLLAAPAQPLRRGAGAFLRGLWPLAAALVLRGGAAAALRGLTGVTGENGSASKTIFWFRRESVRDAILIPLREFLTKYGAEALAVPALALLLLACLALVVWAVPRRGRRLWALGLLLSQFSLGLLQGTGSQMARACQCFAVFVPFVAWLWLGKALDDSRKPLRAVACGVLAVALLGVEGWALNDDLRFGRDRWQYEKSILEQTAADLAALDPTGELPVVFSGEIELSPELEARAAIPAGNPAYTAAWVIATALDGPQGPLYRYENPQTLVINWAQTAFGSHEQMYLLMEELGYEYLRPSAEQQAAGDALAQELPAGVSRQDGYLLVCF